MTRIQPPDIWSVDMTDTKPPKSSPGAPIKPAVIKAAAARVEPLYPATRLLKGAVLEAESCFAEAAALREQARRQADQLVESAKADARRIHDEARDRGMAQVTQEFSALL